MYNIITLFKLKLYSFLITVCPSTWLHFQIKFILRCWSMDISFHKWALSNWSLRRMVMLNAYSISNVNSPLNNFNSDFRSETSKFRGTIVITLLLTGMVTLVLTSAMGLIVTESSLPKPIKRLSYTLVHDRSKRNTVIWITFFFMCIATTLAVVRKIQKMICISVLPTLITG